MFAKAIEIMDRHPLTFSPDTPIEDAADALLARRLDGACVVEGDALVGVVTAMDLIFLERRPTSPGMLARWVARRRLEKTVSQVVGDIMSAEPTTVETGTELEDLATLMVDNHFTVLPVVHEGKLVGVISKWAVLESASHEGVSDEPTYG